MKRLIWGLYLPKTPVKIYQFDNKFWTYINYYRLSIKTASDIGHECHLYINIEIEKYFKDLNVNIHIVHELDTTFYDAINFHIFNTEHKNDLILDGDIILKKEIPEIKADIIYEMKETNSWKWLYEFWVNSLNKLDIKKLIPEWTGKRYIQIINIGAIQIKNEEFRKLYLDRWVSLRDYINENIDTVPFKFEKGDTVEYTTLASQYLITELAHHYDMKCIDLKPKKLYKHYVGTQKFENNLVPYDKLITFNESVI